jgi:hypothetical protein
MDLISPADYARHAGISKAAVSQQIASGRIPVYGLDGERLTPDATGKKFISAAEADRARGQTRVRVNLDDDDPVQIEIRAPREPLSADHGQSLNSTLTRARTASEAHRAQLLSLELEERRGNLMQVSKVEDALAAAAEKIVRIIDQLPTETDDLAAAVMKSGAHGLRIALRDIARRTRTRIADALSLSIADDEPGANSAS